MTGNVSRHGWAVRKGCKNTNEKATCMYINRIKNDIYTISGAGKRV